MKSTQQKRKDSWRCDRCGRKTDTLYFASKSNICDECREKDRRRSYGLVERSEMHVNRMAK